MPRGRCVLRRTAPRRRCAAPSSSGRPARWRRFVAHLERTATAARIDRHQQRHEQHVEAAKMAVMVCRKRSRLFDGAQQETEPAQHDQRSDAGHEQGRRGSGAPADTTSSAAAMVLSTTTRTSNGGDAGRCSGPRRNSTMSTTTPNNARRFASIMTAGLYTSPGDPPTLMIDSADALTAFVAGATNAHRLALDTEFMREKTYRAELCLVQIAIGEDAVCIDPLALASSRPRAAGAAAHVARRGQGDACRAPGSRGAAAGCRTGATGVRHADRRRAGRPSFAGGLRGTHAAAARCGICPRRTRAPTGRAVR